jgi:glycosyltransferase involved in cell wall biosynthesis
LFSDEIDQPDLIPRGKKWSRAPVRPLNIKRAAKNLLRRFIGEERLFGLWEFYRNTRTVPDPEVRRSQPEITNWLRKMGIELMIYPSANPLSFEAGIPYIVAIHDLQHLLQPEFPENSANDEVQRREYVFRNGARFATLILADSETGKEDILHFYGRFGVTEDKVKVLPFLPASYLPQVVSLEEIKDVKRKYSLPDRYLFYPAQFWPHKNHARIYKAISRIKETHGEEIPIVLCGSFAGQLRKQTYDELCSLAKETRIQNLIHYKGYLHEKDIGAVYAGAEALVMPTFHGPTNIPILEAWTYGCAVLTSNLRGIREQAGEAAFLADPRSVDEIAFGIHKLWTDPTYRKDLSEKGKRQLAAYTETDFRNRVAEILKEAKERIRKQDMIRV